MTRILPIAVLGCGTVGAGVLRIFQDRAPEIAARAGCQFDVKWIVVRDPDKPRPALAKPERLITDPSCAIQDADVEVVVELMGGIDRAKVLVEQALDAGKHVVTANKALLATHGRGLFAKAMSRDRVIAFEAAVAGGLPIIGLLRQSLTANRVIRLAGILNGTSNFILTRMVQEHVSFADALANAQELGYAEADPKLDIDGSDAAQKLSLLVQLAFGVDVDWTKIPRRGIDALHASDFRAATAQGYQIRPLAFAEVTRAPDAIHAWVSPTLVPDVSPLAGVGQALNGVLLDCQEVGPLFVQGAGAGQLPTASAVVADLIDIAVGRAQIAMRKAPLFPLGMPPCRLLSPPWTSSQTDLPTLGFV